MVWTGTEGANFGIRASGADVTLRDLVTKNIYALL